MSASGTELEFLREWSGWFCHKIPERSPHSGSDVFPVCFRCAGWQLGLAAAYLRMFFGGDWRGRFPAVRVVMQCVALMLPLVFDGLGNALHLWNSPGWLRGLTGLGVGLCLPWLLAPLAHAPDSTRKSSLENLRQLFWPALAGIIAVVWLDRGCDLALFRVLAAVAASGWYFFLGHFILAGFRAYGGTFARRLLTICSRSEVKA
jgi:uncharacterized membrane protein